MARENYEAAEKALDGIGGFKNNGVEDLAPVAIAHALLAVADEVAEVREMLAKMNDHGIVAHRGERL